MDFSVVGKERSDHCKPEMATYHLLRAAGVIYIPSIVCGGDVYDLIGKKSKQRTFNHNRGVKEWRPLIHTRLVMKEIGRPLKSHKTQYEFIVAVFFAFLGELFLQILQDTC